MAFGGAKRFENVFELVGSDPGAGVGDRDGDMRLHSARMIAHCGSLIYHANGRGQDPFRAEQ